MRQIDFKMLLFYHVYFNFPNSRQNKVNRSDFVDTISVSPLPISRKQLKFWTHTKTS